jgi:hypothetical protein
MYLGEALMNHVLSPDTDGSDDLWSPHRAMDVQPMGTMRDRTSSRPTRGRQAQRLAVLLLTMF